MERGTMTNTSERPGRPAVATTSTLALVNQTAILDVLKSRGPLSKTQIGEATGLSPATVNRLTASLMSDGLVARHGVEASTGGRPPILLAFVGTAHAVAAVQIRSDRVTGALVDFEGAIVDRIEREVTSEGSMAGPAAYQAVVDELERRGETRGTPVLGIGVSATGIITPAGDISGLDVNRWSPLTVRQLEEGRRVPVVVENDANALAIGELHRGVGRESPNFVTVLLERGLGAGIVTNGSLYRGANAAAGEIGFLLVESSSFERRFDEAGDLETRLSAATLTRQAGVEGVVHGGEISAMQLIALARAGDERAQPLADRVLDDVARALGAIASILDPEVIVLGEGLDRESDFIAPALRSRLEGRIQHVPTIATASLGEDAALLGAAEMAIRAASQFAYLAQ
jgi:predicted NBD/HSP70 family sugar kinase